MDRDDFTFDFLREAFPKIDARVIKATVLEHGDDVESALNFLSSILDELDDLNDALPDEKGTASCTSTLDGKDSLPDDALPDEKGTASCNGGALTLDGKDSLPDYERIANCSVGVPTPECSVLFESTDATAVAQELSSSDSQVSLTALDELLEGARKDKEIVISLVKEVSDLRAKADKERAAALRAKSEAARSGEGLLRKADELRKQILEKKQDNLLRMGEIYGEKAVLATEARGLKCRLEQVKLQRSRAETVLVEIKARLQDCYQEAAEERMMAEEDGRAKLKLAQEILAAEEALMATIEEESKTLDMEAESCVQLKEFLSHHGSIIDSLQGEMCVLYEDVECFKRQVNDDMWSSVSTASLPANMNLEGPYIFRKCNMPSSTSSQELGQPFESLHSIKHVNGRMSAASSMQESAEGCVGHSNGSSPGYDKKFRQEHLKEDGGWHQNMVKIGFDLSDNVQVVTSNSLNLHRGFENSSSVLSNNRDSVTSDALERDWHQKLVNNESLFCDSEESVGNNLVDDTARRDSHSSSSSGMLEGSSPTSHNHLNGSWASLNGTSDLAHQFTDTSMNNYHIAERFNLPMSLCTGDGWVFTSTKMEESRSSTCSSLVKVEADCFHSD